MRDSLTEARWAWTQHLRETVGYEAVHDRIDDIERGREDSADFIAGYLAGVRAEAGDAG